MSTFFNLNGKLEEFVTISENFSKITIIIHSRMFAKN
jgi:hypothetical protein